MRVIIEDDYGEKKELSCNATIVFTKQAQEGATMLISGTTVGFPEEIEQIWDKIVCLAVKYHNEREALKNGEVVFNENGVFSGEQCLMRFEKSTMDRFGTKYVVSEEVKRGTS